MTFLQWRRYNFFDAKPFSEPDASQGEWNYLKDVDITCSSSGRLYMVFGDSQGCIHTIGKGCQGGIIQAFKVSVDHIQQMRQSAILVAVGNDEPGINPVVKVWNQEKQDMHGEILCVKSMKAVIGLKAASVSAFRVHESMTLMALGFDDGKVHLYRGDITRTRQTNKPTIYSISENVPITGVEFQGTSYMFVVTSVSTHCVFIGPTKGGDPPPRVLDHENGCKPGCSTITEIRRDNKEVQFVVGSDKAIYLYQFDGKGPCIAFDACKQLVTCFRSFLVCVLRDGERTILNIYDIVNKYVAYSTPLPGIICVLGQWGGGTDLIVVCRGGKMFTLSEKSIDDRLEVLFRKNQYELAVKLAKNNNYDSTVDIFRQYGDYLYAKGDHDGAVTQYIKTIGTLEESYVIRKLFDAQKINELTRYLQALHSAGLAKEDHTTLLINCFTNIKHFDDLRNFIRTSDFQFDAEIAIKVCRSSELFEEALYLARKHELVDYFLKIQLEDLKNFDDAIRYIERLPFSEAERNMEKYGKVLMDNSPEATTVLLTKLCTNFEGRTSPGEQYIHIFVKQRSLLKDFLQQIIVELGEKSEISPIIYNTLLELELQEYMAQEDLVKKANKEMEIMVFLREKKNCFDNNLALVLCQVNNFRPGILHLYEKQGLYHQILSYYTETKDHESIIDICKRFGDDDSTLWIHSLLIFAHANEEGSTTHYFMQVLNHIEKHKLLPAIMVVGIAARSKTATLSLVKEYLVRHLAGEGEKIRKAEESIKKYNRETEAIRAHIYDISHNARQFQENKCSGCQFELDLPSVHFLCNHSFHMHCFDNFSESSGCPTCARENRKILEQVQQIDESMLTLESDFHEAFQNSDDVLMTVADYFSKGVFKGMDPSNHDMLPYMTSTIAEQRAAKPKSLFDQPSFTERMAQIEEAPKKSVFDEPKFFEKKVEEPVAKSIFDTPSFYDKMISSVPKVETRASTWDKGDSTPIATPRQKPATWTKQFQQGPPVTAPIPTTAVKDATNPFDDDDNNPFKDATPSSYDEKHNPFKDSPQKIPDKQPSPVAVQQSRQSMIVKPAVDSSNPFGEEEDDVPLNNNTTNPFGDDIED